MSYVYSFARRYVARLSIASCIIFWAVASVGYADQPPVRPVSHDWVENHSHSSEPGHPGCSRGKMLARRFLGEYPSPQQAGAVASTPLESGRGTAEALEDTDVLHYQLEFEISDIHPIEGWCYLAGSNRMQVRSLVDNLTEFTFRLDTNAFWISSAWLNDTDPAVLTTVDWTTQLLTLDRPYGVGEEFFLTIEYEGHPWIWVGEESGVPFIATLSQAWWAFQWWPCKDGGLDEPGDLSDKATMEFSVTVPGNFDVPSNGVLISIDTLDEGARKRYNWASSYPNTAYGVSFAVSEYNRWTETYYSSITEGAEMPVEFYIYDAWDDPFNRAHWSRSVEMIGVLAGIWGEYPFINEKYGIYNFPFGGGMEHQTMTGQGGGSYAFNEELTAHELAHSWFGNSVTCKYWNDIWINEGFATYGEFLWYEYMGGSSSPYAYYMAAQAHKPENAGAHGTVYVHPWDFSEYRLFNHTFSYEKGAWVLHQLRGVVGDEVFFDTITAFYTAYEYSAATTEDFIAIASATYGEDLTWFFDQWVYNAGAPDYEYGWKTDNVAGQDYLYVRIKQLQESPDPEVFTMPVDLAVTTARSAETITVWNDAREQYYTLPVSGPVTNVMFDPFEWILRHDAVSAPYGPVTPAVPPAPDDARKNRYVSFVMANERNSAVQVEMTASGEFPGSIGPLGWVGEPDANNVSRLVAEPYYSESWPPVVHLGDCAIVPVATYKLRSTWDGITFSDPAEMGTILKPLNWHYGDVVGFGTGDLPPLVGFTPPNGAVNVSDVQAFLLTVNSSSTPSVPTTWVDLHGLGEGIPPNFILNVSDLQRILWGIDGHLWSDAPEHADPADCP
ncbi:MAG: M1 family metallopeptidase [Planctomycetota bacterium]